MFLHDKKSRFKRYFERKQSKRPAPPRINNSAETTPFPPEFSQILEVHQDLTESFLGGIVVFYLLLGLTPGVVTFFFTPLRMWGLLLMLVSPLIAFFCYLIKYLIYPGMISAPKTQEELSATTEVTINHHGIRVNPLGIAEWGQVLRITPLGIDEKRSNISTTIFGDLQMDIHYEILRPLVDYYLGQNAVDEDSHKSARKILLQFRGGLFSWRRLQFESILIWLIGAGFAVRVISITAWGQAHPLLTITVVAYLLWFICNLRLAKHKNNRGICSLEKFSISLANGQKISLRGVKIQIHHIKHFFYSLAFLRIISHQGDRMDLLVQEHDIDLLTQRLTQLDLKVSA